MTREEAIEDWNRRAKDREVSLKDLVELIERKQEECKDNPDNFRYGVKNVNGYRFSEREFW